MEQSVIPFGVFQYKDKRINTLLLSAGFFEMFGYTDKEKTYELLNNNLFQCAHPDDQAFAADAAIKCMRDNTEFDIIYRCSIRDTYRFIHATGQIISREEDSCTAIVWYVDESKHINDKVDTALLFNQLKHTACHHRYNNQLAHRHDTVAHGAKPSIDIERTCKHANDTTQHDTYS